MIYRGRSISHKTTLIQAHRSFRFLTLVSIMLYSITALDISWMFRIRNDLRCVDQFGIAVDDHIFNMNTFADLDAGKNNTILHNSALSNLATTSHNRMFNRSLN